MKAHGKIAFSLENDSPKNTHRYNISVICCPKRDTLCTVEKRNQQIGFNHLRK